MDLSSKQLGEMFESDSADTCGGKFPLMSMGAELRGPGREDPHRHERKFLSVARDIFLRVKMGISLSFLQLPEPDTWVHIIILEQVYLLIRIPVCNFTFDENCIL